MKIYTKTGDTGQTDLIGERVDKDNLRISTIGTLDELNSLLGLVRSKCSLQNVGEAVKYLQGALFTIGAIIAGSESQELKVPSAKNLEEVIDEIEKMLPPLENFILPGGHESAALLHHARSVCRRGERLVVALSKKEELDGEVLKFVNRTSDFLFIMARYVNHHYMLHETLWEGASLVEVDEKGEKVAKEPVGSTKKSETVTIEEAVEEAARNEDDAPTEVIETTKKSSKEVAPPVIESTKKKGVKA